MRPPHLKIAATGLLAVCAILITRRVEEPELPTGAAGTAPHVVEKKPDRGVAAGERNFAARLQRTEEGASGNAVRLQAHAGSPHQAKVLHPASTSTATIPLDGANDLTTAKREGSAAADAPPADIRPIGIQLRQDVRLPAALMNQSGNGILLSDERPVVATEVTVAREQIANSFYRELADHALVPATAEDGMIDPQHEILESNDEENTVVIAPGPQVEEVRERADEIYRVLYGDEAYNRYSMGSAVEVRLPADVVKGTK